RPQMALPSQSSSTPLLSEGSDRPLSQYPSMGLNSRQLWLSKMAAFGMCLLCVAATTVLVTVTARCSKSRAFTDSLCEHLPTLFMIWTAVLCGTATAVFVVYYGRMNEGEHLDRSADSSVKGIGSMDTRVSKLIQMGVVFPTADDDKGCLFDRRRCNVNEFAHVYQCPFNACSTTSGTAETVQSYDTGKGSREALYSKSRARKLEARTGTLTRSGNAIMITCHETRSQISNYDRALRTLQQKLDAAEAYKEEEKLEFSDWLKTVKSEDEIQEYHEYNRKRRDRDKQHRKMKKELKY
ncbi:hypothetical protein FOZ63_019863, partial [Perkinsus olseni]